MEDKENGGFYGTFDFNLELKEKSDKSAVQMSRYLWSFSRLYNYYHEEKFLSLAKQAYDFLIKNFKDEINGGIYWLTDCEGKVKSDVKHLYAHSFYLYGLSEYFAATKSEEVLDEAKEIFNLIEEKFYQVDKKVYIEEATIKFIEKENELIGYEKENSPRTMNSLLHLLEAYTRFFKIMDEVERAEEFEGFTWEDYKKQLRFKVRERLQELIDVFYNQIYDEKNMSFNLFFDNDFKPLTNLKSYGHNIEATWLIFDACEATQRLGINIDQAINDVFFNTLKEGLRGDSLINEKGNDFIDTDRLWWPQAEAVIGLYYFYQKTNEEKYTNKALEVFEFIEKNIVDKRRNSCWLWGVKEDLTPVKRGIAEIWKTPYHVVRMCLEILERIENDSREIL